MTHHRIQGRLFLWFQGQVYLNFFHYSTHWVRRGRRWSRGRRPPPAWGWSCTPGCSWSSPAKNIWYVGKNIWSCTPGPHLATGGHGPAGLVQAEVSIEVSSWCTYTSTPYSSLLDFYLQQCSIKRLNYIGPIPQQHQQKSGSLFLVILLIRIELNSR